MTNFKKYCFCCLFLLFSTPLSQANPAIDVLIFSPHPDDETLACGGTILKALQENKKVKIVFLTNGEAYSAAASAWNNKRPEKLTSDDYIVLGEVRKKEARFAAANLGLQQEDIVFLDYPDGELFSLWRQKSIKGLVKENLLKDIKGILNDCQAKRVYLPHPLDNHSDHKAATLFVYQALKELREENKLKRVFPLRISYYLIHQPEGDIFQESSRQEDIARFKQRKAEVLRGYVSQLNIESEKDFLLGFIKDKELFWDLPENKATYLKNFEEEWERIAENMHSKGYKLNLGPVADVARQIEDVSFPLAGKQRMYSDNPQSVIELVSAQIRAMAKGGLTSVVKHFPGLGSVYADTHLLLAKTGISKKELFAKDLVPFQKIIENYPDAWIMIDHAVYSSFSDKPASLSFEIQTELLRKKMGFKGIIIVDELLGMQAIEDYAYQKKIKDPYIGEIAVLVFKAGADIALIFPPPEDAVSVVFGVVESVKKALKDGRLLPKDIDVSVSRILKEKERIFGIPLVQWLGELTLEEKIMQKIMIDVYQDISIFKKYNLGGVFARDSSVIEDIQKCVKIPLFVAGQNEGGLVSQQGFNIRSAYVVGSEFEWLASETLEVTPQSLFAGKQNDSTQQQAAILSCDKLDKRAYKQIISGLINFIDEFIAQWRNLILSGKEFSVHPNNISPLFLWEGRLEIRPFEDVPAKWARRFSDQKSAFCAYQLLKKIFDDWVVGQEQFLAWGEETISLLESFKERLKLIEIKEDKRKIRILCLAAHPDDEDALALAYFKKRFNCETYVLLATRGEGGENEVGSSLYEELGALRTDEIERSAAVLGVDNVYYLDKKDFGYCVNPDEAILEWGKEDTLEKLVYFLRLIKPHIIVTKHSKLNLDDRHGQHKALMSLAEEAFDLAGKNMSYPEMLKDGLEPWQPFKFYQRVGKAESLAGMAVIDPRVYIIPENKTVQQFADEALMEHRSQGSDQWVNSSKIDKIAYQLVKSRVSLKDEGYFFDGIKPDFVEQKKSRPSGKNVWPSGVPGIKIIKGLNIGLVDGNKRILADALNTLGCDFKNLGDKFIGKEDLSQLDVIVLGEGSCSSPFVIQARDQIFSFVEKGGNLIVFPQRPWSQSLFSSVPCHLRELFDPISDESALVVMLRPEHPLFNFPNKISEVDFKGWRQERGLYFPTIYAKEFVELLSCLSDQGGQVKGGYLVLTHGKGSIIYTGYSWVRQLRESHFGAFKNLSNMLSYSHREK